MHSAAAFEDHLCASFDKINKLQEVAPCQCVLTICKHQLHPLMHTMWVKSCSGLFQCCSHIFSMLYRGMVVLVHPHTTQWPEYVATATCCQFQRNFPTSGANSLGPQVVGHKQHDVTTACVSYNYWATRK